MNPAEAANGRGRTASRKFFVIFLAPRPPTCISKIFRDGEISLLSNSQPRATLAAPKNTKKPKCAKSEKVSKNRKFEVFSIFWRSYAFLSVISRWSIKSYYRFTRNQLATTLGGGVQDDFSIFLLTYDPKMTFIPWIFFGFQNWLGNWFWCKVRARKRLLEGGWAEPHPRTPILTY